MSKRFAILVLGILVTLGLSGYWFAAWYRQDHTPIASLPPAQALGFFAVPGLPQAWEDLQRSKYFQQVSTPAFWQRALGAERYQQLSEAKAQLERQLGFPLTEQTVGRMLGREVALALVPSQGALWPVDVIAYIRLSNPEKIAEALARTFSPTMQDLSRQTQTVEGIDIVTLHPKVGIAQVSYAFLNNLAVLSTDPAWIVDAIRARHGTSPDRLHNTGLFQTMQLDAEPSLLAYGCYDGAKVQALTTPRPPLGAHVPAATFASMLRTTDKVSMKALRASAGVKIETLALYPPNGIAQAFRQIEHAPAMPPFPGVPAETFYLTHLDLIDLQALWPLVRQFTAVTSPELLSEPLAHFRHWTGVEFEHDVLPLFTGVGSLGITAPLGSQQRSLLGLPGLFLTLGVTDGSRVQQLLQTIVAHAGGPRLSKFVQPLSHAGHTIFYLNHPFLFIKPAYVVSHQQLIMGSDVRLLQHMLDAASGQTPGLAASEAYGDLRRHFRITGGSITFIDVTTAVEKTRDTLPRVGFLLRSLMPAETGLPALDMVPGDPRALVELLRPLQYIVAASQAESQGVRTEAIIAFEDLH